MKKYINLILILLATLSCKSQENLKDFYYPFYNQTETKIYKYVDKNDSTKIEYWKVTSNPKTNELKTVSYDSDFNVYNTFDEIITESGAELTAYSDFEMNDKGERKEIKAKVVDKDVYKWGGDKEYTYSVKYVNKYGRFDFKKKRVESGIENITVNGKEYEALKFRDEYIIFALDHDVEQRFYQDSFYVKDIGMIKYKRKIPIQHELIELELAEILTETEFEKIKASR
ncbi:hypothetical protein SAMN05444344_1613 [Tenacibaculum mesophilum]|uniref:DKNYY family protein n=1 Tax=Tenacibaculum mesophilum TaxID=104268 RepID=A0ABM7CDG1_9FLAO|nr:hypothetical protein D6200_04080 [Tenacibaculum mesophilum]SHF83618.1 hypothetical protein SAMN05444344_1613 [Tenacibaculum mesophilum]